MNSLSVITLRSAPSLLITTVLTTPPEWPSRDMASWTAIIKNDTQCSPRRTNSTPSSTDMFGL